MIIKLAIAPNIIKNIQKYTRSIIKVIIKALIVHTTGDEDDIAVSARLPILVYIFTRTE